MKEYKHNMKYVLKSTFSVLLARQPVGVVLLSKNNKSDQKTEKNVKKQQKMKQSQSTTKPSLLLGIIPKSQNLFLRNEPNFNTLKLTATTCPAMVYNDLQTKPKNGTNPNEPNLKPILNPPKTLTFFGEFRDSKKPKPHFSEACPAIALGRRRKLSSVILARRPVGVVVFNKKRRIPALNPNPYPLTPIRIIHIDLNT